MATTFYDDLAGLNMTKGDETLLRPVRKSKRMKQGMQQATDKADTSMTDMIMATHQTQVKKNAPRATSKASENAQKSWRKTDKYSKVMCHATPPVLADSNPQVRN